MHSHVYFQMQCRHFGDLKTCVCASVGDDAGDAGDAGRGHDAGDADAAGVGDGVGIGDSANAAGGGGVICGMWVGGGRSGMGRI